MGADDGQTVVGRALGSGFLECDIDAPFVRCGGRSRSVIGEGEYDECKGG